ncbi:MAG TPA: VWA domain-containing protein [Vicinamibacteria bacterium]|nr:VWA domain-containing protein [Vicinamibacteria bacterium]
MRNALAVAAGVLLLVPRAAAADVPEAGRIVLDVLVKDKKDVAVPDLKPAEVEVSESGSKRPVESVRFVKGGEAPEGAPSPGSLVSLVFGGLDANQQKRARQAVEELLKHDLGAGTEIAVFRIGLQLWTVQPFTSDLGLVRQAVAKAASDMDQALGEPDAAARKQVAETLGQLATGKAKDPAAVSRAEVLGRIVRQGDRLLRQQQEGSALYLLMAVAKGQATAPGRKAVLYFTGGLSVSSLLGDFFKSTISEANRAHVAFYGIDASGLAMDSEAHAARDAVDEVRKDSMNANPLAGGGTTRDKAQLGERMEASARANWKQPLKELSESTGGFAVLDVNDYRKPMERLAGDLSGFYEITYTPGSASWDGAFRSTEVRVSRGGTKVQQGNGYIATPPDEAGPILAYEMPLLDALKAAEPRKDFKIAAGTFAFATAAEGREVTLVAELPISSFKVTTDPKAKLYRLHFALLALVKDEEGKTAERVSQDYPFEGPLDKLPQLQQGNVVFKRKLVVPPGRYTLELVAQDRESAATSVYRAPLAVAAAQGLAVSSVVVVRRMEPAPPLPAGAPEDPLRGEAMRIVPSLDDPISKATTARLPVYVVVYPLAGAGAPQMTLEFSADGRAEGRNTVVLPAPDADGRIRFLAPIPIDRYGPGRHELKVTVRQGASQAEERVAFTLQP